MPDESTRGMTERQLAQRLLALYRGREDFFAEAWVRGTNGERRTGYRPVARALTLEDLERHIRGEVVVGVYPLRRDSTCLFGCIDVDAADEGDRGLATAQKLRQAALDLGFPEEALLVSFSGAKGHHVDVFFAEPIRAGSVRLLLQAVVERAGFEPDDFELFPKQDFLPAASTLVDAAGNEHHQLGNLIKLPLALHPLTGQRANIVSSPGEVHPASPAVVYAILGDRREEERTEVFDQPVRGAPQQAYHRGQRTKRMESLAGILNREGVSREAAERACLDENRDNCAPPLPEGKVLETVRGIYARYQAEHRTGPLRREGWRELIEEPEEAEGATEAKSLPPLPLEFLPAPLADLSAHLAGIWNVDPALYALPGLAVLSGAIGNTVWLHLPGRQIAPALLWVAIIARTGSGKTPAAELVFDPMNTIQSRLDREHGSALGDWKLLPKAEKERTPPPEPRQVVVTDSTWEAAVMSLHHNPGGLLWVRDEIGGVFKQLDAYHARGSDFAGEDLLSSWSQQPIRRQRMRDREYTVVPRPFLSICGGLQPARVRILGGNEGGRLSRLLCYRAHGWPNPDGVDPEEGVLQAWNRLVTELFRGRLGGGRNRTLRLSDGARKAWTERQHQRSEEMRDCGEEEAAFLAKLDQHAGRLALVKFLAEHPAHDQEPIDADTVHGAWEVARVLVQHQLASFLPVVSDFILRPEDRALEEAVVQLDRWVRAQGGTAPRRDAQRAHVGGARDAEGLNRLIKRWQEKGLGTLRAEGGGTVLVAQGAAE